MGHQHHVLAHFACTGSLEWFTKMKGDLMPEKVKIYPAVSTSPLDTSQVFFIEFSGFFKAGNMVGDMERIKHGDSPQQGEESFSERAIHVHPPTLGLSIRNRYGHQNA
ncbi:hypothetical protein D3C81_1592540 [compost metagenome]